MPPFKRLMIRWGKGKLNPARPQCMCRCRDDEHGNRVKCGRQPRNRHYCEGCGFMIGTGCCWRATPRRCHKYYARENGNPQDVGESKGSNPDQGIEPEDSRCRCRCGCNNQPSQRFPCRLGDRGCGALIGHECCAHPRGLGLGDGLCAKPAGARGRTGMIISNRMPSLS